MKLIETTFTSAKIIESDGSKLPDGVLCRIRYPICNIGMLNANNRVYEKEVWERVLGEENIQNKLSTRTLYGQAEHPAETASDLQLTSHVIFEFAIGEDNRVYQTLDVLDTPTGRIIDTLLRAGCQVGVSTRAEGDLEEFEIEEGKTAQRVIPESYRYVTTDFTADPSTFNVEPLALQRNVAPTLRREMETKEGRPLARMLLESIQKSTDSVDEAHTSVAVSTDDGKNISVEAEGDVEVHTSPKGDVSVTSPLVPKVQGPPMIEPGNTGLGMPAVEPEEEPALEEPEDEEEMPRESKVKESEELTEEAWLALSDAQLKEISTVLEGEAFNKCVSGGGRVRTVSGEKEHGLEDDEYVRYCYSDGKSYRGEVRKKENEARLSDSDPDILHLIDSRYGWSVAEQAKDIYENPSPHGIDAAELNPNAIHHIYQFVKRRDDDDSRRIRNAIERWVEEGLGDPSVLSESKINEELGDLSRRVLRYMADHDVSLGEAERAVAEELGMEIGEFLKELEWDYSIGRLEPEDRPTESTLYNELTDLKVKEASVRAERDTLLENSQDASTATLQVRILADRLAKIQETGDAEINGLRALLEKKAREVGTTKETLAEAISSRVTQEEMQAALESHRKEVANVARYARDEARTELLKEYFDRRIADSNLRLDENSRALLVNCRGLGDVDALLDKLVGVARRSALHATSLNEVTIQEAPKVSPEQAKINKTVGYLMKNL